MKLILTNTRIFTGGADLTGASNKLELAAEVEDVDVTTFGAAGWKELLAGLASTKWQAEGFWEAGDPGAVDNVSFTDLGGIGPWTMCPDTANVGDLAYLTNALRAGYSLGGKVGDAAPWSAAAAGSWPLTRGVIAHPPGTARSTSGAGSEVQLGAVPAGKQLYAALHVLSVAGTSSPTITVSVESDDAAGFASPVTRVMFDPATAESGQILRVAGAVTDTYWRAAWTITGDAPSFLLAVAFGVA